MLLDHIKLHFIILVWGMTAIIGALVQVSAMELVFYRTLFAFLALGGIILFEKRASGFRVSSAELRQLILTGALVAAHWILFFAAVKTGGASIALVGLSTATLWTALLAPLFLNKRVSSLEIILGIAVMIGLSIIANSNFDQALALLLGVLAAALSAVFSFYNQRLAMNVSQYVISFYEMLAACICTFAFIMLTNPFMSTKGLQATPTISDLSLLLLLSLVCTVYAFTASIELLRRMSVFLVNLCINLEPIYGMILAVIVLREHERLNSRFYLGSSVILCSILIYPVVRYSAIRRARRLSVTS